MSLKARRRPTLWYAMDSGDAGIATFFPSYRSPQKLPISKGAAIAPLSADAAVTCPPSLAKFFGR
jgi:hypothetical protein